MILTQTLDLSVSKASSKVYIQSLARSPRQHISHNSPRSTIGPDLRAILNGLRAAPETKTARDISIIHC
jgi:hypothetical protein